MLIVTLGEFNISPFSDKLLIVFRTMTNFLATLTLRDQSRASKKLLRDLPTQIRISYILKECILYFFFILSSTSSASTIAHAHVAAPSLQGVGGPPVLVH